MQGKPQYLHKKGKRKYAHYVRSGVLVTDGKNFEVENNDLRFDNLIPSDVKPKF